MGWVWGRAGLVWGALGETPREPFWRVGRNLAWHALRVGSSRRNRQNGSFGLARQVGHNLTSHAIWAGNSWFFAT